MTKSNATPKASVLKVSKSVKFMAAFGSLRGGNRRAIIRILGEAEDNFNKNGRLVLNAKE